MIRALIMLTALLLPGPSLAQESMPSPEHQQMQQMMQRMDVHGKANDAMYEGLQRVQGMDGSAMRAAMDMNHCMQERIGIEGMERMSAEGQALDDKIKALCVAGKRDEAEAAQKEFAQKMMQTKEYQSMRECADKYKDALQDPSMAAMKSRMEGKNSDKKAHVCG